MENNNYGDKNMKKNKKEVDLLKSIIITKEELEVANKNFENAQDDLIDYYSYQIKATKAKFNYLIKQVKQKKIAVDMINSIEIGLKQSNVI